MTPQQQTAMAARATRVLRGAVDPTQGWVSAEATVRVEGELWRPAVVVGHGEPPCDGVVEAPPVVAVEVAPQLLERWLRVPFAVVWVPGRDGVVVLERGRVRRSPPDRVLTVRGHAWMKIPASALVAAVA